MGLANFLPGLASNQIITSQVAGIVGMSHHTLQKLTSNDDFKRDGFVDFWETKHIHTHTHTHTHTQILG
jgi:hypothetical protein